jgi:hypothetical protein
LSVGGGRSGNETDAPADTVDRLSKSELAAGGKDTAKLVRPSWLTEAFGGAIEDLLLDTEVRGDSERGEAVRGGVGGRALSKERNPDEPAPGAEPNLMCGVGGVEHGS